MCSSLVLLLYTGGLVGDLPFRPAGKDNSNTAAWDVAWNAEEVKQCMGQAAAMVDKLDFVLFKVSLNDVNMVSEVLQTHGFTVMPWYWYKARSSRCPPWRIWCTATRRAGGKTCLSMRRRTPRKGTT
jgi:hypothetical protein